MPTTLVFTTSAHRISRVIRLLTQSETSHVAIGTEIFGVPVLIHSALDDQKSGVQITTREKWLQHNELIAEYEIVQDVSANLGQMIQLLGEKYDKMGLIGFVFVIIANWLGKWIQNPFASPTAFVCPRYVLRLDPQGILIPEWKELDAARTTPHDLLEICRKGDSFNRVTDTGIKV